MVALLGGRAVRVAETRPARVVGRIAPVVGAALVAAESAEPVAALALPVKLVALGREGADGVAVTSLAAFARSDFPVVDGAAVARQALHVGQTRALARLAVADRRPFQRRVAAEEVADARRALLRQRVAEEALLANVAAESFRVEEALETFARPRVAVARPREVDIVAALARPALATRQVGIAKVIVGADVAARPCVAFQAFADHVLSFAVQRAARGVGMARIGRPGTRTLATGNVDAETRVAVVALQTGVAVISGCGIATVQAAASAGIAQVGVPVTLAPLARREVPNNYNI